MGLMRRLAVAALAAVLVLSTALGERVTFRLSADIDPVQYPAQERKLAQGLKSLFRLLTVEGDSLQEVASFVSAKLSTIEGVLSTSTSFLLKKYKESGRIMQNDEEYERLKICP